MTRPLHIFLVLLNVTGLLSGCAVLSEPTPTSLPIVVPSPTAYAMQTLPPTWTPRPATPTNTRVIPLTSTFTPGPSPTPTRLPERIKGLVVGVQDSRTVEVLIEGQPITRGFIVRLLGVEPPLLSDPWSAVAAEWLTREVRRQVVVLESDEKERDNQGNLLRYVWKEGRMLNVSMVQQGLAAASEDATKLRYGADLLDAQADAQKDERGIWGPAPTPTFTPLFATATLTTTQSATSTLVATETATITPITTQTPSATATSSR